MRVLESQTTANVFVQQHAQLNTKKTSNLCITVFCYLNPTVTGGFAFEMLSCVERAPMSQHAQLNTKKTSNLCIAVFCYLNPTVTGGFAFEMLSCVERAPMSHFFHDPIKRFRACIVTDGKFAEPSSPVILCKYVTSCVRTCELNHRVDAISYEDVARWYMTSLNIWGSFY